MYQPSRQNLVVIVLLGIFLTVSYLFWSPEMMFNYKYYIPEVIRFSPMQLTAKSLTPNRTHPKWIIVTSINHPTEQIKRLSQIPGWTLLVIADLKTPKNWTLPNSTTLTVDAQKNLGYQILKILPWNTYTRKMVGYLFAIQHGAQFIYDTDDDNAPDDPASFENSFEFEPTMRGLVLQDKEKVTANPYIHFGQSSVWPRGFPLEDIGQDYNNTYTVCQMVTPLIQQGLVNGDPDVDEIFRLTRKKMHSPLKIQFDDFAPPVVLPKSVLTPFNSQNTMFHYDAFWSMMLPVSVTFRVTDIWRGYWTQPLLWGIGGQLAFLSANTTQLRNPHVYLRDFGEEDKLYQQAGRLTNFLREWQCSDHAEKLYGCMVQLTQTMVDHNFWEDVEMKLIRAWIEDLKAIGYKMPKMRNQETPCLDENPQGFVMFTGISQKSESEQRELNCREPLRKFCNFPVPDQAEWFNPMEFSSTLLVVTFNHMHFENIWILDLIYRPHFPNMVYCGDLDNMTVLYDLDSTVEFINIKETGYSFVNANTTNGFFLYECALRVIDMNYKGITGYLFISDDLILNFWNNAKLNPSEVWWLSDYMSWINLSNLPPPKVRWMWWDQPEVGLNVTLDALEEISASDNEIVQDFSAKREEYGFNVSQLGNAIVDIFYLPSSKQNTFYEVGWIFRRHNVFLEIAVPFIMTGLSSPNDTVALHGNSWTWTPLKDWNPAANFAHFLKFSRVFPDPSLKKQYCSVYVNTVLLSGSMKKPLLLKHIASQTRSNILNGRIVKQ